MTVEVQDADGTSISNLTGLESSIIFTVEDPFLTIFFPIRTDVINIYTFKIGAFRGVNMLNSTETFQVKTINQFDVV
jgi:hypothetical protein